jgi:hypothetical protein
VLGDRQVIEMREQMAGLSGILCVRP